LEPHQSDEEPSPEDGVSPLKTESPTELAEIDRLQKEISNLKSKIETLSGQNSKNQDQLKMTKDLLKKAQAQSTKAQDQLTEVKSAKACVDAELAAVREKMEELENKHAAPKPNSQNSGIAPSNDIGKVKKPTKAKKGGKKKGAQPGHKRNERPKFTPEEADTVNEYEPESTICPECGEEMVRDEENDRQVDQVDIPPLVVTKTIHLAIACKCPTCDTTAIGQIPRKFSIKAMSGHAWRP
jgi:TolA-binding protein